MEFKIFNLNCWGIPNVSKNHKQRMHAIGEVLATSDYDVVCLQEIWSILDYELLKEKAKGALPFSHYFHSGFAGSGVCILSRHPIVNVFFHQWTLNGYIHKLYHGDWYGGKGIGLCRLKVDNLYFHIYSAHLHAEYNRDCDEYEAHRVLQAFDTAQFIQITSQNADLVVLAGDLNTEPGDLAQRIMNIVPDLIDSFEDACEDDQQNVATCDNWMNSYTPKRLIGRNIPGKRIDYIMFHPGVKLRTVLKSYELPLPNRVPGEDFSYSDHEAVAVTLSIAEDKKKCCCENWLDKRMALEEAIEICDIAIRNLTKHKVIYWIFSMIFLILIVVTYVLDIPYGPPVMYQIFRSIMCIFLVFNMLMATLWNRMEKKAVLAGKLNMEVSLNQLPNIKSNEIT